MTTGGLRDSLDLAGVICESFAFQVPATDFALAALKGLSHLAPHAHVLHLKNEDFSRERKPLTLRFCIAAAVAKVLSLAFTGVL